MDVYYEGGDPLPEIGAVVHFVKPCDQAYSHLSNHGFMLPSEHDIFEDDGARFRRAEFLTGQEGVPNLLGALTKDVNPYSKMGLFGRMNIDGMRFGKLVIDRYIQPTMGMNMEGGKRKKRTTRRVKKQRISRRRHV